VNAVISIRGLVKDYRSWRRRVRALDGVDLEVGRGEVFGLLGTNGAGKTTLVKILLGLSRLTGGEVRLRGADPGRPRARLVREATVEELIRRSLRYRVRLEGGPAETAGFGVPGITLTWCLAGERPPASPWPPPLPSAPSI